ncbi:MAG: PEP/pyruvate-binding domain-containing protein [Patescibacteria group bacterium]|jgi:pyruvate,water dikinase
MKKKGEKKQTGKSALQYSVFFKNISKKDVGIAGGKGASLGEMTGAGIPVPPGFVVTAQAFERFIEETDIDIEIDKWLHKVNPKDISSIDRASHELRDVIKKAAFPKDLGKEFLESFDTLGAKLVAVRSSATAEDSTVASWAGELESYLFVDRKKLLVTIKTCWSSLFTPRAIFYRFEKKMHRKKVSVAVVVQKMVNSEISGITFTAHPVTKDRNQMVIEAGWGQGESIVSGKITPDTYIFDKKKKTILDVNVSSQSEMIVRKGASGTVTVRVPARIASKQKLNPVHIKRIAEIFQNIERHYRSPQDIEWAIEKGNIYIVQSRPITTL